MELREIENRGNHGRLCRAHLIITSIQAQAISGFFTITYVISINIQFSIFVLRFSLRETIILNDQLIKKKRQKYKKLYYRTNHT